MRRAYVAGAAGFIGYHLCTKMLDLGWEVEAVDSMITGRGRNALHLQDRGARFAVRDISSMRRPIVADGPLDAVIHLASPASPVAYAANPIETLQAGSAGTLNLLRLAEITNATFLLASTSEVYGNPEVHPQHEMYWGNVNPVGPRSVYDEAKRFAEAATAAYTRAGKVDGRIARIFNTYGPRMNPYDGRAVPQFITQARAGAPITVHGTGSQTRSLCYIDDLVEGLLRLLDSTYSAPVNLGNPEEVTVNHLAEEIRRLTRSLSPIVHIPRPQDDPDRRCPDISTAKRELYWQPGIPLREGLRRTIVTERGEGRWLASRRS